MEVEKTETKVIAKKLSKEQLVGSGMAFVLILLFVGLQFEKNIYIKIAFVCLLLNMIFPKVFYPFGVLWFSLSNLLGLVMPKVLLSIIFFSVVLPMSLLRKLIRKDSLKLNMWKKGKGSVMKERNYTYTSLDLEKPY